MSPLPSATPADLESLFFRKSSGYLPLTEEQRTKVDGDFIIAGKVCRISPTFIWIYGVQGERTEDLLKCAEPTRFDFPSGTVLDVFSSEHASQWEVNKWLKDNNVDVTLNTVTVDKKIILPERNEDDEKYTNTGSAGSDGTSEKSLSAFGPSDCTDDHTWASGSLSEKIPTD